MASTADATEVSVTLELKNPNDASVELIQWSYSARIDGRTVYSGIWVAALTLPAGVPMLANLPIVVPAADAANLAAARWSMDGTVGYRATRQIDRLLYQIGINRLSAGFQVSGETVQEPAAPANPTAR